MAVLDTNLLIAIERGNNKAEAAIAGQQASGMRLRVPAQVWMEFLTIYTAAVRGRIEGQLAESARFEPFDLPVATVAIQMQHELARTGRRLDWADAQIAATALHYNEPLLSNDTAFDRVPGLKRIGF